MAWQRTGTLVGVLVLSTLITAAGVGTAYWLEVQFLPQTPSFTSLVLVGLLEEGFVRLAPLVVTFYLWSYYRGRLLSKTEGLLATIGSGVTVGGLELVLKLQYLDQIERIAHFDALVLPIVFVHLPLALLAGRFAYALGERIHGSDDIGLPQLSRRTLGYLVVGYLILVGVHVAYNAFV
ncbi:MAG: hypothetical protein R3324_03005 [Halobacteriales archaeon]|nr:hypothetical protein [Halobacteriales archaeon]